MIFPSKYNMLLATFGYHVVSTCRGMLGKGDITEVSRGGVEWELDLREGIDLTIYVFGYFQRQVVKACQRILQPGAVALDIGANMGALTLHMASTVGDQGRVVAVEPTCYPLQRLRKNLQVNSHLDGRVKTIQAFLTSPEEKHIPESLQSSWRLSGDRSGAHSVHRGVPQETSGALLTTLDQLVESLQLDRLDLIKIDVDGSEDDVIAGGGAAISRFKPKIIMEVAPYTLIERGIAGDSPLVRLKQLGYTFEDLKGKKLESETLDWVKKLDVGYGVDVIAKPLNEITNANN